MLTMMSLFDGSGGFPLAAQRQGITPIYASEVEPFPIKVTRKRFPGMKHLGDVAKIHGGKLRPVDVVTFGSPCFPAGTLVLTAEGYKPIEEVKVGDMVLTHKSRWKKVIASGRKTADTIVLKGNHYGLECTANHPIYAAYLIRKWGTRPRGYKTSLSKSAWFPAGNMRGKLWAVPLNIPDLTIPIERTVNAHQKEMPPISEQLFYFVGRWLGDGYVRTGQRPDRPAGQTFNTIFLCDSHDKADEIIATIAPLSKKYSVSVERTCTKVKFTSQVLCKWLVDNFGHGALGKRLPAWALGMAKEYRVALLKGLIDSDGWRLAPDKFKISTSSKALAHGIRLLGETLGYSSTVYKTVAKGTCTIEGRPCSIHDNYQVALTKSKTRVHYHDDLHSYYKVRDVREGRTAIVVYNIAVEDDQSYIAEGIVVHNCQDLSLAGKRAGLEGSRSGLFFEAVRIVEEMREATNGVYPRFAVWENVDGSRSSHGGEDFRQVLEAFCKVCDKGAHVPRPKKWPPAGAIMADGYSVAWRLLDAQYWGVPQRRKRIFLVADFRGQSAPKILFDEYGLPRNTAKGSCKEQTAPASVENGSGSAVEIFENHSLDSRYTDQKGISPSLTSFLGTSGNNRPLIVRTYDVRFTSEGTINSRANVYETDTSRTLEAFAPNPAGNYGGVAIVAYGLGRDTFNQGQAWRVPCADFWKAQEASKKLAALPFAGEPFMVRGGTPKQGEPILVRLARGGTLKKNVVPPKQQMKKQVPKKRIVMPKQEELPKPKSNERRYKIFLLTNDINDSFWVTATNYLEAAKRAIVGLPPSVSAVIRVYRHNPEDWRKPCHKTIVQQGGELQEHGRYSPEKIRAKFEESGLSTGAAVKAIYGESAKTGTLWKVIRGEPAALRSSTLIRMADLFGCKVTDLTE